MSLLEIVKKDLKSQESTLKQIPESVDCCGAQVDLDDAESYRLMCKSCVKNVIIYTFLWHHYGSQEDASELIAKHRDELNEELEKLGLEI